MSGLPMHVPTMGAAYAPESQYGLMQGDSHVAADLLRKPSLDGGESGEPRRRSRRGGGGAIRQPHLLLRVVFLALLAVIAALAIAAMIVVTRGLNQSYNDTRSVYVGGVALFLTETGYTDLATMRSANSSSQRTEVAEAAADLYRMRAALTTGVDLYLHGNASATPPYSPTTNAQIAGLVAALVAPANATVAAIDVIQREILLNNATANDTAVAAAVQSMTALEPTLLGLQAAILVAISVQALANVQAVETAQYAFMGVILGVLVLIALAVYLPVERRIKHMTDALHAKNTDLRRAAEELTLLMQLSPHGIFCADPSGHLTYANDRWTELTGLDAPDRDGWIDAVVHPDDRAAVRDAWTRVLGDAATAAASQIMALEFRLVRLPLGPGAPAPSGSPVWVLLQCRHDLAEGADGRTAVRSVVGSLADVTDRKRLEQDKLDLLARAAEAAEAHRREQEVFVDTICHGIRNPLNGILNNVDLLRESVQRARQPALSQSPRSRSPTDGLASAGGLADSVELMEAIDAIETCANYQRVITDDVLSLSRLQAVGAVLHMAEFRLGDLVRTSIVMFAAEARADDIELTTDVADDASNLVICHDRERLAQILANLLSNAIKFTRTSRGVRRVTLHAAVAPSSPAQLTLAVSDTGPGIAADDQPLLFHRFRQVGSATSVTTRAIHAGGSGLGLSICKLLVDAMGGTIRVRSELGRGAEFVVVVPCTVGSEALAAAAARSPTAEHPPVPSPSPRAAERVGTLRVLIAEDNAINQTVLRRQLRLASTPGGLTFEVAIANNGQEAVDLVAREPFDVVLMDIDMPVLDGIQATRELRARGHALPVIGLSGNARQEQIDGAIAAGMQAYLVKPYSRKDLVDVLVRTVPPTPLVE